MTRLSVFSLLLASTSAMAADAMHGMDHSQMPGMDHSAMQSMDDGMMQPAAPSESRTPIAPVTDADRAAVFTSPGGHQVHDSVINSYFLADKLEWQNADDGSALAWDLSGWIGGDTDRLWLRSEGERNNGKTEDAEIQALWGHAISPWWDVVGGVRQDLKSGAPQTWAAFGVQGMALYNFEAEATAFLGEGGQSAVRLEGDYDILLTNRLILQPTAELNIYGKNDPQRGIGSGLSNTEAGLRLRYEIRREFAPYIGVTWNRTYGNTADYAREEDEDRSEARLVLGVRLWF
ncbi:copper resistance protein B [Pseudomonas koreensis]|uniref:Copper resistance protein B n=2 Tax=Pseudomonas TaxID=286 RepID=A0A4Q4KYR9_9PSED|nr:MULTISPECIES: copper resistance protein B [Pseudomonas]MDM8192595.1 copper resistance protein B [Pseudomonas fluorescens]MDP8573840.1 copper resistance protein B [Pseudomonas iranensis]RYM39273.1 copper resistance protein B [Pseudomonas koreensis]